jgi:hypothetical protein
VLTPAFVRNLACVGVTLRLRLEPRGFDVREVDLGAPTRDAQTLLQLLRLDITRRPPSSAVVGADLIARPACVRPCSLIFCVLRDLPRSAWPLHWRALRHW